MQNFLSGAPIVALLILSVLTNILALTEPRLPEVARAAQDDLLSITIKPADAAHFLPPASGEWVRISEEDALYPGLLHDLSQAWPGGSSALQAHPGFPNLLAHLDMCLENGPRVDASDLRAANALYLHPDGSVIGAQVALRMAGDYLGRSRQKDAWITKLAMEEARALRPDQHLQWLTLAGQPAIHTVEHGKTQPVSPLGSTDVNLAVALSHRAVLRLDGTASMESVRQMISAATSGPRHGS